MVEIQILFLFCKLSCVLNLIKPGQRIVLRKHLPPAVCFYFHIIGEVPGEDKKLKLQKDKNVELQKENKTISDGGITVDFPIIKVILLIDHRIAGDHQIPGDHRILGDHWIPLDL